MAGRLKGRVVAVRDSGDIVTSFTADDLKDVPTDDRVAVSCDGHTTAGIFTADHQQPEMTLLAMLEDGGALVLTLVGESASRFLGIADGSEVTIKW